MLKYCIICGTPVTPLEPVLTDIIVCNNDHCIRTVENSIGLHYCVDQAAPGKDTTAMATYSNGKIIDIKRYD